jgi:hypothetical protein
MTHFCGNSDNRAREHKIRSAGDERKDLIITDQAAIWQNPRSDRQMRGNIKAKGKRDTNEGNAMKLPVMQGHLPIVPDSQNFISSDGRLH